MRGNKVDCSHYGMIINLQNKCQYCKIDESRIDVGEYNLYKYDGKTKRAYVYLEYNRQFKVRFDKMISGMYVCELPRGMMLIDI